MQSPSEKQSLLLICAHRQESKIILEDFTYSHTQMFQKYTLFQLESDFLSLLELGNISLSHRDNLETILRKINPAIIVNYGICGALSKQVQLHQNYLVTQIRYEEKAEIKLPSPFRLMRTATGTLFKTACLFTAKMPVLNRKMKDEIWQSCGCELVDLEGYIVAQIARDLKIPLIVLKHVSDYADHHAKGLIKNDVRIWQKSLKQTLIEIISSLQKSS